MMYRKTFYANARKAIKYRDASEQVNRNVATSHFAMHSMEECDVATFLLPFRWLPCTHTYCGISDNAEGT